uniref:Secreted protein n=1 Tax=Knipowitschia caucasica TaxID=637954 RepID=A0AAV2JDP4_KNICA
MSVSRFTQPRPAQPLTGTPPKFPRSLLCALLSLSYRHSTTTSTTATAAQYGVRNPLGTGSLRFAPRRDLSFFGRKKRHMNGSEAGGVAQSKHINPS